MSNVDPSGQSYIGVTEYINIRVTTGVTSPIIINNRVSIGTGPLVPALILSGIAGVWATVNSMAATYSAMDLSVCARFASAMAAWRSSVASSMANMGGLVSGIRAGVSSMNAAILQLNIAVALQKGLDILQGALSNNNPINTGIPQRSFLEKLFTPSSWLFPQSNDPRNIVQKVVDAVFFNPITRIGVGVAGIVVSVLSIPVTFGLSLKGIWYSGRIIDFAWQDIQDGNWAGNPYHRTP